MQPQLFLLLSNVSREVYLLGIDFLITHHLFLIYLFFYEYNENNSFIITKAEYLHEEKLENIGKQK